MALVTTTNFDQANNQYNKEPVLVMEVEGMPYVFSSSQVFTTILYDDPGVYYDGVYIYDGLRPLDTDHVKPLIDRKGSSSTISQKLEQWDGKASVETFNIKLVDYNLLVSEMCSPGQVIEDIINRKVRIFYGFKSVSYPEDYILLFKGYVNNVNIAQGSVNFTFTDPSSRRKQQLFNASTSKLTTAISNTDTALVVSSTNNFYTTILNAKGEIDNTVTMGLVLDGAEIVTYTNADIISSTQVNVVRGQFGTTAVAHDADIEIKNFLSLQDNPVNIALKSMLSGWNGPWVSDVALSGIVNTDNGSYVANSITFNQRVDVVRDYGITLGDFVTISGSPNPTNNDVWTVANIINSGRTIVVEEPGLIQEDPIITTTKAAFRSKYDTYPIEAGLSLTTDDVLVSTFESLRNTFIQVVFTMNQVAEQSSGKTWIENDLFKPIGAYSLTQGARISMGITHPPLANDLTKFIDQTNTIDAKSIIVQRGLNSRFFYNEILFNYDYDPINDTFYRSLRIVDADAQNRMRQVSVLQLDCKGLPDTPTAVQFMNDRAKRLLLRYKFAAETIELRVFFSVGHTIDAGDTVVLNDSDTPTLQIANTDQGGRGIYNRIMEVQERSIDISGGSTKLVLLSNNGYAFSDRYAVVGPASYIDPTYANTTTTIRFIDSFSVLYPGAEYLKWTQYQGSVIRVHNKSYTNDSESTFTLDGSDPYIMHLDTPLSFVPGAGDVIEFAKYDATSATTNAIVKATFAAKDSTATIFSGSSQTVFVLDSGYSSRYKVGQIVYVMNPSGSNFSPDLKITNIAGDVITVGGIFNGSPVNSLGFIPSNGDLMQLGGFLDGGNSYRLI